MLDADATKTRSQDIGVLIYELDSQGFLDTDSWSIFDDILVGKEEDASGSL